MYYHGLCNHGMSPGPYFGGAYVMDRYYQELHKDPKIIQIDQDLSMLQLSGTPYMQNQYFVNRNPTAQRAVKALGVPEPHSKYLQDDIKSAKKYGELVMLFMNHAFFEFFVFREYKNNRLALKRDNTRV